MDDRREALMQMRWPVGGDDDRVAMEQAGLRVLEAKERAVRREFLRLESEDQIVGREVLKEGSVRIANARSGVADRREADVTY